MRYILLLSLLVPYCVFADKNNSENKKPATGNGFLFGAGVSYQQQIYKGYDQRTIAIPLVGYTNDRLKIFGPYISYSLMKSDHWTFDVNLSPRFNGIDEEDSDFFIGINKRKDSADAGLSLTFKPNYWSFQFKALTDILANSKGSELEFTTSRNFFYKGLTFEPSLKISHQDENLVNYYYGVKQSEVNEMRGYYNASQTINRQLNLSIAKPINQALLRLDLNHTWYGSEIKNSPLVDSDTSFGVRVFYMKYF